MTIAILAALSWNAAAYAARAMPLDSSVSVKRNVDDNDTVAIPGNVHPNARPQFDAGPTDQNLRYDRMILVLNPRPNSNDRPDLLMAQLYDPKSPQYHQWLTPQDYAKRFGISDGDLADVTAWLQRGGFSIDEVGAGRMTINFSGTVGQVERAFKTQIHEFKVNGKSYHANVTDPQVPRALADIVGGVVTLHNFPKQSLSHNIHPVSMPEYTSGTSHYLAPADFSTIYNTNPLYTAGTNGTGHTIAIVGRTDIALADVRSFRSTFGLPINDPTFVHNGTDPGNAGGGEESEGDLDVEWSGAVAPNATIKFVISASTQTTDGVDLSAQYIVNNNLAPAMSTSFGQCESVMGTAENAFYNNLWSQAASQGISSFVSSGDSGAAGCDGGSATVGTGRAVSGLASTPYNIAVGGSQFNDTASPSTYWNSTNNSSQASAKSYIPEIAWNESANVTGGSGLWSSSGGVSGIYAKPSWQVCVGVPADGKRDIPDVALAAAGHDGYLIIQGSGLYSVGGTSAASPSFAGLMALVVQKTGARQGNANTKFYSLANAQYGSGGTAIFHDVTSGNNSVPGVTGFSCGTGYDAVTGVGTVDANAMVNSWSDTTAPTTSITAPTIGATVGGTTSVSASASDNVTVTKVEFYLDGALQSTDTTSPYSWSWNTTGTSNGSHSLVSKAYDAAGNAGTSTTVTITVSNSSSLFGGDFDGDGRADLLFQNSSTNQLYLWYMSGPTMLTGTYGHPTPDVGWQAVAVGDFNGDGKTDIIFSKPATGQLYVWYMSNSSEIGGNYLPTPTNSSGLPDPNWHVVGLADVNNDGSLDLVFHHVVTGLNYVWYFNHGSYISGAYLPAASDLSWNLVGVGDFDGNGHPDLFFSKSTGENYIYFLNQTTLISGGYVRAADLGWHVAAVADYNGDGKADLIWQNSTTRQGYLWYLNGLAVTDGGYVNPTPDANWLIVGPK